MAVRLIGDKGRGVVATAQIELGDLVLWAQPAAVEHGAVDEQPDAAALAPLMQRLDPARLSWGARMALAGLDDGSEGACRRLPAPFWDPEAAGAAAAAERCNSGGGGGGGSSTTVPGWPPSVERLDRIVGTNAFGDAYDDLAAAAARGAGARSVVGLWPAFSYFNHSCIPSTVHYVVGDGMLVRAAADIAEGEELAVSYLGREEFAPASSRRALLRERWGFECRCERCEAEAAAPPALTRAVEDAHARVVGDLRPAFLEAAGAGDGARLAAAARALQETDAAVRAAIREHAGPGSGAPPAAAAFAEAALYELLELSYAATQLPGSGVGGSEAERAQLALAALSRCLSAVDTVSRGAELHVFIACALLRHASALHGADSPQAAAALQLVGHACEARYGKMLPAALWDELQRVNGELSEEFL